MFKKILIFLVFSLGFIALSTSYGTKVKAEEGASNLIANPSVELSNPTGLGPSGWQKDKWGTNTSTFTYLNTGHTGSKSIKVTTSKYTSGDAKWYFTPVSVTPNAKYTFSDYYQSSVVTEVDLQIIDQSGKESYISLGNAPISSTWALFSKTFTMPSNAKSASIMHILYKKGFLVTDDYVLQLSTSDIPIPPPPVVPGKFSRGLISLTFDDGLKSFYTNAMPIMAQNNYKGTAYILTGDLGLSGNMTLTQVNSAATAGHEIGSHTVTHPHLNTLTTSQIDSELSQAKVFLENNVGPIKNFAAPYGEANILTQGEIKKYYRSNRSVDSGFNTISNFNFYNLKVQNILQTTTLSEVQSWISTAKANNYWLILVYHQVDNSGAQYGTSIANFQSQINAIKNSGLNVVTVNQALDELSAQL